MTQATGTDEHEAVVGAEISHDLYRVDSWIEYRGKSIALLDPGTGNRLMWNRPPTMIENDPVLRQGLDFWRRNADTLTVTNLYGLHGTSSHLGSEQEFEGRVRAADLFGYESHGSGAVARPETDLSTQSGLLDALALHAITRLAQQSRQRSDNTSFLDRLRSARAEARVSAPFDIRTNGTDLERRLLIFSMLLDENSNEVEKIAAKLAYNNAREWVMVATLGLQAQAAFGEVVTDPKSIVNFLGLGHQDFTDKLGCLGVGSESILLNESELHDALKDNPMKRVGRTTRILPEDIGEAVHYPL